MRRKTEKKLGDRYSQAACSTMRQRRGARVSFASFLPFLRFYLLLFSPSRTEEVSASVELRAKPWAHSPQRGMMKPVEGKPARKRLFLSEVAIVSLFLTSLLTFCSYSFRLPCVVEIGEEGGLLRCASPIRESRKKAKRAAWVMVGGRREG